MGKLLRNRGVVCGTLIGLQFVVITLIADIPRISACLLGTTYTGCWCASVGGRLKKYQDWLTDALVHSLLTPKNPGAGSTSGEG
jgi:hypothetical protein